MKDKTLFKTPFIDTLQNEEGFIYAQRRNRNSIACLCFKKDAQTNELKFLVHMQPLICIDENKPWDYCYPCCITGSLEVDETVLQTARKELYEEAGLKAQNLDPLLRYPVVATTQMNEVVDIFIFDVTNIEQTTPTTDGSKYEQVAYNKWASQKELEDIIFNAQLDNITLSTLPIAYLLFLKHIQKRIG